MQETVDREPIRLKSLLQEWREAAATGETPQQLSHEILKEIENCVRRAGSVPVDTAFFDYP